MEISINEMRFLHHSSIIYRVLVRAHFSKRGILKLCKAFLSRICHAVVFTQFGYADSKSAPCQALFLVFPFQNCKTKWHISYFWRLNSFLIQTNYTASNNSTSMLHVVTGNAKNMINIKQHINYKDIAQK